MELEPKEVFLSSQYDLVISVHICDSPKYKRYLTFDNINEITNFVKGIVLATNDDDVIKNPHNQIMVQDYFITFPDVGIRDMVYDELNGKFNNTDSYKTLSSIDEEDNPLLCEKIEKIELSNTAGFEVIEEYSEKED